MAQPDLIRYLAVCAAFVVGISACGGSPAVAPPASPGSESAATSSGALASDKSGWGKFHSKRFNVTVPLPDGTAWKIDDHRSPALVAVHPPTSTTLQLIATQESGLMNRQRCEERARQLGWLAPASARFTTLEDEIHVGPDAYDSRVWVALEPGAPDGKLGGHVFLFGAFLRRCLLVHYATAVDSAKDEQQLASRLAIAAERIVKGIKVDPLRTTDDATVPRDRPDVRR